jgi:hypothetical protein
MTKRARGGTPAAPKTTTVAGSRGFDVFISHSADDAGIAEKLAAEMGRRGLRIRLQEADPQKGFAKQDEIRRAIAGARSCVVLLSPSASAADPGVSREWSTILEKHWKWPEFPVIPVQVGEGVEVPAFLAGCPTVRVSGTESNVSKAVADVVTIIGKGKPAGRRAARTSVAELKSATLDRFAELRLAMKLPGGRGSGA